MATARRTSTTTVEVLRTEQLTPAMVRVVLGGEEIDYFGHQGFTDSYVKLLFPDPSIDYPEPFDIQRIREEFPRDQWPVTRTYTVRWLDKEKRELALDFVTHGDSGIAGPWAQNVKPGEKIRMLGPGGAYAPRADVDRHLLIGDESALPAIAAAVEQMPADATADVLIEVASVAEEQPLQVGPGVSVRWIHRGDNEPGAALVAAVQELPKRDDVVQAFVHGETSAIKQLRGLLRDEHAIPRELLSISGYWRIGMNEDGFQESKRRDAEAEKASS